MRTPQRVALATLAATGLAMSALSAPAFAGGASSSPSPAPSSGGHHAQISSTGLKPGQVKHVWLIILENKSYDATFTGLNQNSYLWKTLPSQGALLTHYFGTGHTSMDNYTSMVSGQSPSADIQSDCSVANTDFGSDASIITQHTGRKFGRDDNFGQAASLAGPNAANGQNGCTYSRSVPTLFNQLDAAHRTWKGYAQDLGNQPGREDGLGGAPGTRANNPTSNPRAMQASAADKANGITSFTGAQANDQYVAKHFPFPWFHALTGNDNTGTDALTTPAQGGTDTDANHIANLDNTQQGLINDLKKPADQVPAFNWITPNNCSDAHDATCVGNNMSGLFDANGNPDYSLPLSTAPKNHTGGLYASDLFLRYYVPLIERSAAFKDGGLIDITFDEGNPPFYNSSFNNATDQTPTALAARRNLIYSYHLPTLRSMAKGYLTWPAGQFPKPGALAKDYVTADAAGQTINGHTVNWEPTGPNSTLATDAHGNQLYPGPGFNSFITRPPSCEQDVSLVNADQSNCVKGARTTRAGYVAASTLTATATAGSTTVQANATVADIGRMVTGAGIPTGTYVGNVTTGGPNMVATAAEPVATSVISLVDARGRAVRTTAAVNGITLSATGVPGHLAAGQTPAANFDATDATPGGGITGSVLISPFIKPGTVSDVSYNHYSWLRTMEDILQVSEGDDHAALPAGTVSDGLDGRGHLGFAAQAGLAPFGRDVFTNAH